MADFECDKSVLHVPDELLRGVEQVRYLEYMWRVRDATWARVERLSGDMKTLDLATMEIV